MADGTVQVPPDGTGKKIDTSELTVGGNTVERQRVVIADSTNAANFATVDNSGNLQVKTNGVIASKNFSSADVPRTTLIIWCDDITGVASETVLSCSINKAGTVTTSQTSYTVTAGKTLRISSLSAFITGTTTTAAGAKVRIRQAASGVAATSPVIASVGVGMPVAVATASNGNQLNFAEGIEVAAGQQICLSQLATSTASKISACLIGFEY
jgi:hypothetical protein